MKRGTIVAAAGFCLATQAFVRGDGAVTFSPLGLTTVTAGTPIDYDVDLAAVSSFDLTNILIGSATATDVSLVFSTAWTDAFDSGFYAQTDNYEFAPPGFEEHVFLEGDIFGHGTTGPDLLVGTLTIHTEGMMPGDYTVGISDNDSYTHNLAEGADPEYLTGTLDFTFTIVAVPEPSALALLALGSMMLRRR